MRCGGMLVCASLVFGLVTPVPAQPSTAPSSNDVPTVRALMDVEQSLLKMDRERYETLVRQRSEIVERMSRLHSALDAAVREEQAADSRRLTQLVDQVQSAEAGREALLAAERAVVERISDRLQRLRLFEEQLEELLARHGRPAGELTGTWDLTLMPTNQSGMCALRQSGAVVNGTYQLEGGWTGSLQGTLINRKVFLVRIDSKLGKSMELEGYLSADGKRIRGNWLNHELAGSEGSTGQWSARRRTDTR